jgi:hypothetical protein
MLHYLLTTSFSQPLQTKKGISGYANEFIKRLHPTYEDAEAAAAAAAAAADKVANDWDVAYHLPELIKLAFYDIVIMCGEC